MLENGVTTSLNGKFEVGSIIQVKNEFWFRNLHLEYTNLVYLFIFLLSFGEWEIMHKVATSINGAKGSEKKKSSSVNFNTFLNFSCGWGRF